MSPNMFDHLVLSDKLPLSCFAYIPGRQDVLSLNMADQVPLTVEGLFVVTVEPLAM